MENNEAWLKKQTRGGKKDPSTIIKEIQNKIQSWLEKRYEIPTITIDSLFESDTLEEQNAVRVRELLLATCVTSPGISLNGIRLPKTKRMLEEDKQNIKELLGTKDGIHKGIVLIEKALSKAADKIAACSSSMQSKASLVKQYKEEYNDKNGNKLVIIYSQRFTDTWHVLFSSRKTFDVNTKFPIKDLIVARGTAEYEIYDN